MRADRLQQLRDHLDQLPDERFDMRFYSAEKGHPRIGRPSFGPVLHNCGTAACVAGWAMALFAPRARPARVWNKAAELLGLDPGQAHELFEPDGYWIPDAYSRIQAVATLDHLIKTGEVQWTSRT